jgi:hypothetical protein
LLLLILLVLGVWVVGVLGWWVLVVSSLLRELVGGIALRVLATAQYMSAYAILYRN